MLLMTRIQKLQSEVASLEGEKLHAQSTISKMQAQLSSIKADNGKLKADLSEFSRRADTAQVIVIYIIYSVNIYKCTIHRVYCMQY